MRFRLLFSVLTVACIASVAWAADVDLSKVNCIFNPEGAAKAEHGVKYKEGTVYFCCENCPKKFSADPAKYAALANHQLAETKQYTQVKCPLTGRPINSEISAKVGEVTVGLCCNGCKGKVAAAEGKAQVELVFNDKSFKQGYEAAKKTK